MILVDMERPKACNECWLYNEDMECCIVASGGTANRFGYNNSTKPDWCPIKTEIPDNVTNGDVICALWNVSTIYKNGCYGIIRGEERTSILWFSEEWWNAPYKLESEDKKCK